MLTYIALLSFTEQGIENVQSSPARAASFEQKAKKLGIQVKAAYWTLGAFDGVLIFDAPDEQTATAALLSLGMQSNVKTQSLRAFTGNEFESILSKVS